MILMAYGPPQGLFNLELSHR